MIVVLAGGTGGGKLARGLVECEDERAVTVVANTGDDVDVYGVRVSPDPDLVTYRLAGILDEERGYGVRGDTREVMRALSESGADAWFDLGDRDLATCLRRTGLLQAGERPTVVAGRIARGLGVATPVIPMSDDPVRTEVVSGDRRLPFQEFMVRERGAAPIDAVEVVGADAARPAPEALAALAAAEAIVVGPSNPVISIGPILAVGGMREAIVAASAPVVAVSPFVSGRALKGPTEAFCRHAGLSIGAAAMVEAYGDLLGGVVADEPLAQGDVPSLCVPTRMDGPGRARGLASATLDFARKLPR